MRWSVKLLSPSLAVEGDGPLRLGPDPAGRAARVTVSDDGEFVTFAAEAEGPPPAGPLPPHPEWHNRSHLAVLLNPGHDHATRLLYAVDDAGAVTAKAEWALPGEEPADTPSRALDNPPAAQGRFERVGEGRFRARVRIPASAVWPKGAAVAGLAVRVGFHEECVPPPLCWPPPDWTGEAPLGFGDLYRRPPPLRVAQIDVPAPCWGEQTWLSLSAALAPGAPASGQVRATIILPGDSEEVLDPAPWRAEGSRLRARFPVVFPHRGKWANDLRATGRLRIAMADEAGEAIWAAEYPFGFDAGLIVRERYGPSGGEPAPRPEPSDPSFVDKFRRYVLARLPDYRRRTTREGAPSDFYLADVAGAADLDLSRPGWIEQVAQMLTERFGRWDDALCAAAMWIYHPAVTRHSSSWSRVAGSAAVETIPRLGGCFCGDTARLGAALAEAIGRRSGEKLRGYTLGLRGHLATLVETPAGRVVIDGMIGLWYHTLDNARLARLEEMRADRRIAERMWYCPRAHGHEFFFGTHDQIIRRPQPGELVWPAASG